MDCKYSYEDIIKLTENSLSTESEEELKMHLNNCKKCKCYYESLELANRFALDELPLKNGFNKSIMSQIDKNRYLNKKYSIKQLIYKLIPTIKYTSVAMVCCLIFFALVLNIPNIKKYINPSNVSSNHVTPEINTPNINEKVFDSINEDINNDNNEDLVELVYSNGNLSLKTFKGTYLLDEDVSYEHEVMQLPKLLTVRDKKGNKYILATSMFMTNKIGSTTKGWLYDVRKNCVQNVIDIEERKLIDYEALPLADGKVKLVLPEIKVDGVFNLTDEYKEYKYDTKGSIELSSHIDYFVNDYNGDGCEEIITSRRVFTGSVDWFPICYIYTVYNVIDGQFAPISYLYDDNETKRAILKSVFMYGSVKIENGKLINAYPEYELFLNESKNVNDTVQELLKNKVLITNNNNEFYLNPASNTPINTIKPTNNSNTSKYTIDILARPQISLENEQEGANEDPIHAAIDFINLKASEGALDINGKIGNEDFEIIQKTDEEVIIKVNDSKVQIDRIYLRQINKKDNDEIWYVAGYDPIWIGTMRGSYVQGSISSFDKKQNMITIEVEKNIHKGADPIDSEDSPYVVGSKETFRLIEPTKVNLDDIKHIVIEVNKYSVENTNFYGGDIKYYEKDRKWSDKSGTEIDYENITSR